MKPGMVSVHLWLLVGPECTQEAFAVLYDRTSMLSASHLELLKISFPRWSTSGTIGVIFIGLIIGLLRPLMASAALNSKIHSCMYKKCEHDERKSSLVISITETGVEILTKGQKWTTWWTCPIAASSGVIISDVRDPSALQRSGGSGVRVHMFYTSGLRDLAFESRPSFVTKLPNSNLVNEGYNIQLVRLEASWWRQVEQSPGNFTDYSAKRASGNACGGWKHLILIP